MIEHVSQGSPLEFKAEAYNAMADAANHHKSRTGTAGGRSHSINPCVVQVKNDTGEDLGMGAVVELSEAAIDELDPHHLWFIGDTPDLTRVPAILLEPLKEGEIGPAQIAGVCLAKINVTSTSHKYGKFTSGQTSIESATAGPLKILVPPTAVEEKLLPVLINAGGVEFHRGVTQGALNKGSSATVHRYDPGTTTLASPTQADTVYNDSANIATNKKIGYLQNGDKMYVVVAECPLT
jgi:hypothetical protein